jgi:hypothetical protein
VVVDGEGRVQVHLDRGTVGLGDRDLVAVARDVGGDRSGRATADRLDRGGLRLGGVGPGDRLLQRFVFGRPVRGIGAGDDSSLLVAAVVVSAFALSVPASTPPVMAPAARRPAAPAQRAPLARFVVESFIVPPFVVATPVAACLRKVEDIAVRRLCGLCDVPVDRG